MREGEEGKRITALGIANTMAILHICILSFYTLSLPYIPCWYWSHMLSCNKEHYVVWAIFACAVWSNQVVIVASVQIYQPLQRRYFKKELSIYHLLGNHKNILKFITTRELPERLEIMLQYHQRGSLLNVLRNEILSVKQFLNIAVSIASGEWST